MEDAQPADGDGGGGVRRIHSTPCGFAADEPDGRSGEEVVEGADGVGAAAHAGQHRIGEPALLLQ